jgi:hypothetical protein
MPRYSEAAIQRDRESSRQRYHSNRSHARKVQAAYKAERFERRPFIMWDGEGWNRFIGSVPTGAEHCYMLFGCSTGQYITSMSLGTRECLDLMLFVERENPDAFHVGFAFEYDVNMILKDLPRRMLGVLKAVGQVIWNGYRIKHTPHKSFSVSKNGLHCCIYDSFGFFHTSYEKALDKYNVGSDDTRATISDGKRNRGSFTFLDLEYVIKYWKGEISLGPALMEEIRTAAYGGGFRISEWHGPGALAAFAIKHNNVADYKSRNFKPHVLAAIRSAYAGGRFQAWQCGEYEGTVYTYDINSAYIFAASLLPNLRKGTWHYVDPREVHDRGPARFGLYHIVFDASGSKLSRKARASGLPEPCYPLFHRGRDSSLTWPDRTEGWYWTPEAKLVLNSPDAKLLKALEFKDDGTYPFKWVNDGYNARRILQERNDPAEKAFKWALAAIYGAFARRVGWDRKRRSAPRSHELAWAGYITSCCRAMVYEGAAYAASKGALISIDTDGITTTTPIPEKYLPNDLGTELGQWKPEEFSGMLYWQNGIYWLRNNLGYDQSYNDWTEAKTRGVPKGRISLDTAKEALAQASFVRPYRAATIRLQRTRFIGYRQALNSQFESWRQWITAPYEIAMGGNGKGRHLPPFCAKCQGKTRMLHTITHFPPKEMESQPHKLPWLEPAEKHDDVQDEFIFGDDDL